MPVTNGSSEYVKCRPMAASPSQATRHIRTGGNFCNVPGEHDSFEVRRQAADAESPIWNWEGKGTSLELQTEQSVDDSKNARHVARTSRYVDILRSCVHDKQIDTLHQKIEELINGELGGHDTLDAIFDLRSSFARYKSKHSEEQKDLYPGRRSGMNPIEFFLSNYKTEIESGHITPGQLSLRDRRLYDALDALAKRRSPKQSVADLFVDLGLPPRELSEGHRRASAAAVLLECDEPDAVRFFQTLRPASMPDIAADGHNKATGAAAKTGLANSVQWKTGRLKNETPPDFIKRNYTEYLKNEFSRADLRYLDKGLYDALANWLVHNKMPDDLDLPTRAQKNTRWIDRVERGTDDIGKITTVKEARRFASAVSRRGSNSKSV